MSRVRVNFSEQQIYATAMAGVVTGVNRVAVMLGKEIGQQLSKPGTGRVYVKRRLGGKGYRPTATAAMKKAGIKATSGRHFRSITRSQANALLIGRRAAGLKNRSLRSLGFHKASAPGQPPAVDTGNLRRSWQVGFGSVGKSSGVARGSKYVLRVGSNAIYARRMEFGGGAIAPRPYVRPAIEKVRPFATEAVNSEVRKALGRLTGGRNR